MNATASQIKGAQVQQESVRERLFRAVAALEAELRSGDQSDRPRSLAAFLKLARVDVKTFKQPYHAKSRALVEGFLRKYFAGTKIAPKQTRLRRQPVFQQLSDLAGRYEALCLAKERDDALNRDRIEQLTLQLADLAKRGPGRPRLAARNNRGERGESSAHATQAR